MRTKHTFTPHQRYYSPYQCTPSSCQHWPRGNRQCTIILYCGNSMFRDYMLMLSVWCAQFYLCCSYFVSMNTAAHILTSCYVYVCFCLCCQVCTRYSCSLCTVMHVPPNAQLCAVMCTAQFVLCVLLNMLYHSVSECCVVRYWKITLTTGWYTDIAVNLPCLHYFITLIEISNV